MSDFNSSDCYPINLKTIHQLSGSKLYLNMTENFSLKALVGLSDVVSYS